MKAVVLDRFGDESVLRLGNVSPPALGSGDVRIRVRTAGVNRADLLQREGHYPPPAGASELLGLECAGEVLEVGRDVQSWRAGERVVALLPGGGYAEEVVVDAGSVMRLPDLLSDAEGAAIAETYLTVFLTVFQLARAQ